MSVRGDVNQDILDRLFKWGDDVVDFKRDNAWDALYLAQAWFQQSEDLEDEDLFVLALNILFNFWMDERSENYLDRKIPELDWEAIIAYADSGVEPTNGSTPEIRAFESLHSLLASRSRHIGDIDIWRRAAAKTFRGMWFEEQAARGRIVPTFADCIERGAYSTSVETILMGAYLVHGIDRPARAVDGWLADMERYMCIYQRLLNDLVSAEKERREVSSEGVHANAVLVMETAMLPAAAREFVERQCETYRRLTDECFERLGLGDPCVMLVLHLREQVDRWYKRNPERYAT